MDKILFLCTGNYYRSRFAEHLFNYYARKQELDWFADSRGLAIERGTNNVGAISIYAKNALQERGIIITGDERFPIAVTLADFHTATRVIALDESEHRPLMSDRFPEWEDKIEYWLVHDVDKTVATTALGQIEQQVLQLLRQLG